MRSRGIGKLIRLSAPAILIVLIVISCVAQQASTPANKPCTWDTVPAVDSGNTTRKSGKAQVDLLRLNSDVARSKCAFVTLAGLRTKAVRTTDLLGGFSGPRQFTFELLNARVVTEAKNLGEVRTETTQAQGQVDSTHDTQELAKKLSNPVSSLISVPLQSNFDFGMGTGSGWRYTLNLQPVIPIKLSDKWNLISRTIIPIIHQGNVTAPGTSQSGLGDTTQSFFFSPNKTEPFVWAVGPVALIPTATDARLGTQKWGLGPTALVLKQQGGWTYGMLANHIWSVAGKSNRSEVSSTFLQPFLSHTTKDAWTYGINTESTYDWTSGSWAVPINPLVSKLVRFGKHPVSFGGGLKCWATSPEGGPEGCSIRIVVTALFPKK